MYSHFKNFISQLQTKKFVIVVFIFISVFVQAQKPVTITVIVVPPFSTNLSYYIDHPNKVMVTFLNTSNQPLDVYIQGKITSDNGIEIKTDPSYHPPLPITLNPGVPYHLTPDNIGDAFSSDHVLFSGTSEEELRKMGGLPEGDYQFCFSAYDFKTSALLSNEDMGCSNMFVISYVDPPVVLSPVCGDSILVTDPQNILINWTVPVGACPNIRYKFIMTEMHPGDRNPNDAMAAASPPYFLEKDLSVPQLLIGPSDPPLIKGRSYAFIVQAYDPNNEIIFNNKGISEVCWFRYQKQTFFGGPNDFHDFHVKHPDLLKGQYLFINGKIHYRFVEDNTTGPLANEKFDIVEMFVLKKPDGEFVNIYDLGGKEAQGLSTSTSFDFIDPATGKSIPQDDVKFNEGYMDRDKGLKMALDGSFVVSGGMTDNDGNFTAVVVIPPGSYYGLLRKNVTAVVHTSSSTLHASAGGGVENSTSTTEKKLGTGDLYRVLRIVLHDHDLYGHPAQMIIPDEKNNTMTLNNLEALVRTYHLNVKVIGMGHNTNKGDGSYVSDGPLAGMYGKLMRKTIGLPPDFPKGEGNAETSEKGKNNNEMMIGEAVTGSDGILRFNKIVQYDKNEFGKTSEPATKKMTIYVKPSEHGETNYTTAKSYDVYLPAVPDNIFSTVNDKDWPVPTVNNDEMHVKAKEPKIVGLVQDAKNKISVNQALIYLYGFDANGKQADFRFAFTQQDGKYVFDNVRPDLKYRLEAGKFGYELGRHKVNSFQPLGRGVQEYYEFDLTPLSGIYGSIVNEKGEGVPVHIYLDGGYQFTFKPSRNFMSFPNSSYFPTSFHVDVPENHIHLIVDADNEEYADWDTTFTVQGKYVKLHQIVLKKESRKLEVKVNKAVGKFGILVSLAKARVVVDGITDTLVSDANGKVRLTFQSASSENNFDVTVLSPVGKNFQTRHLAMSVPVSKQYASYTVVLRNGTSVEGYVYDNDDHPLAGAVLRWENGSSSGTNLAKTDDKGHYVLAGVPVNKRLEIVASLPASQYIGKHKSLFCKAGTNKLNFRLKHFNGMAISHLLGFTLSVDSLQTSGGDIKIWGYLSRLPSNPDFAPAHASQRIPFSGVSIVAKKLITSHTAPVAYPRNGYFVSDINRIPVKALGFAAYLQDDKGIAVKEINYQGQPAHNMKVGMSKNVVPQKKTGTLRSKLFLNPAALKINKLTIKDQPQLGLFTASNEDNTLVNTLTAAGASPLLGDKLKIIVAAHKTVALHVYGFDITANPGKSYLKRDTLVLDASLHTKIAGISPKDLNIHLGKLRLSPEKLIPVTGKSNLEIALQNWKLKTDDWTFDKTGFSVNHGYFDMMGLVLPFTDLRVKPTALYRGKFDFSNMKLLGVKKLHFSPDVKTFLSNKGAYWRFEIYPADDQTYCASVKHLPAFDKNDSLIIQKIVLFSKMSQGSYYKLPEEHPWVHVYKTMLYKPAQLYVYSDQMSLNGVYNLQIPNTNQPVYQSHIKYNRQPDGTLKFIYEPFNFSVQAGACTLNFERMHWDGKQILSDTGFFAEGEIYEKPLFRFSVELKKTAEKHTITATIKPTGQAWNFSRGKTLHNMRGSMTALSASWPDFHFTGDVEKNEFNGASGPMSFIVKGELTGDPEKSTISLSKVDTPFGKMNFTFDASVPSIVGNLKFDKKIGTAQLKGGIQMVLDKNGWYFLGGGLIKIPNPYFQKGQAGIVFGNYPVTKQIENGFLTYSGVPFPTKGLFPKRLNGFMFAATVVIQPSPVPDIHVHAVVASVDFNVDVGASFGLGANFDEGKYLALADLYLYASLKVTATGLVSGSVSGKLYANVMGVISQSSYLAKGEMGLIMSGNISVAGKTVISGTHTYGLVIKIGHNPNVKSISIK